MMVYRSPFRLPRRPSVRDPFEGRLRQALGQARARRVPVTLPEIRSALSGGDAPFDPPATTTRDDGRRR